MSEVTVLIALGPPSSPPAVLLLTSRMKMAIRASAQNSVTENPRLFVVHRERREKVLKLA